MSKDGDATLDATQAAFMDDELCILVDERDAEVGAASKRQCHRNENIFAKDG